jgi:uncharacterized membrane protein AbrB (regulator of aidB expression)
MTCLLATCPGGITQLASISEDLGADPLKVSLLHMVRLFTIFVVLPPLIKVLLGQELKLPSFIDYALANTGK